jgi:hypothetical protein
VNYDLTIAVINNRQNTWYPDNPVKTWQVLILKEEDSVYCLNILLTKFLAVSIKQEGPSNVKLREWQNGKKNLLNLAGQETLQAKRNIVLFNRRGINSADRGTSMTS